MSNTQDQSSSHFDVNANDDEYFASTVEVIDLGRDPVTGLASEPAHVFDIVWNLDLNTHLSGIKAPYVFDVDEHPHAPGIVDPSKYIYLLGSSSKVIQIELKQNFTGSDITSLVYTDGNGERTGSGANEVECMADLAKQMSTDGSTVTLLAADGSQDVTSSITPHMIAMVSSGVGNSLEVGGQDAAITAFMTNLKSQAGTHEWYGADANNPQSAPVQVKKGLAQLFDKDPQLNNLIGSAATSSTFIDVAKVQAKMQDPADTLYTKLFSEQQLREVLEAVADKGSRILGVGPNRSFNFNAGDSITAVVKVRDSDSNNDNSDRWLVTLQQS